MGLSLQQKRFIDFWLGKTQLAITGAVVFVGATLPTEPEKWGEPVAWILETSQSNAWWIVLSGPILAWVIQVIRRKFCNPWALDAIQKILDEFQIEIFGDLDDPVDHHKITLFKKKQIKLLWWPPRFGLSICQGWLVPVARSEHLAKKRIESFPAPDSGDACQGVVGMAWRHRNWVYVPGVGEDPLPEIKADATEEDIRNYAQRTCVHPDWVRARISSGRKAPQAYAALKIQLAGEPWGVLVIDSRAREPIDGEKLKRFRAYGNLLTPLLERI